MSTGQTTVGSLAVELGLSDEQFRQALAHAQVMAEKAAAQMQQKVNQATQQTAASTSNGAWRNAGTSQGLLQVSRAIDDVQYGIRGVLNNVEPIVSAFGGTAGMAGAISIAGVAIYALIPAFQSAGTQVEKFFGVWQSEAEKARNSVAGLMGGLGGNAAGNALKGQAEFLMGRTDQVGGLSIDFLSRAMGMGSNDERAMANNMRRSIEASALMSQAFTQAADASKALAAAQRGASAQYDLTTTQQEQTPLNRQIFQAAVDRFGGGDNLRTKLVMEGKRQGMMPTESRDLYGRFAAGEGPATNKVIEMLGLQAEQTKVMADDYERVTGSARELAAIEWERKRIAKETADFIEQEARWFERAVRLDEERALEAAGRDFDKQMRQFEDQWKRDERIANRQFGEYESAVNRQDSLFSRRDSLMNSMNRSEIVGAADVFGRNLNAGMKNEELKQLEEINQGIKELKPITGLG
jgi:hypothetical protein